MERIIEKANVFTKLWVSIVMTVIYVLCIVTYQRCIQGLEKPAGFAEAVTFLFKYPSEYTEALLVGLLLHIISIVMVVTALLCLLGVLGSCIEFDILVIVNLVLGIIMSILNAFFAKYVFVLALVVAVIGGIAILALTADN